MWGGGGGCSLSLYRIYSVADVSSLLSRGRTLGVKLWAFCLFSLSSCSGAAVQFC
jgi:hypothetical protein